MKVYISFILFKSNRVLFKKYKSGFFFFLLKLLKKHSIQYLTIQGWTNFFLSARFSGRANKIRERKKMGAENQSSSPIETQLEILPFALYYLNSTYSFHF